jgi:molybdate transport system substrate-binding protein
MRIAVIAAGMVLMVQGSTQAADIQILASNGVSAIMRDLGPAFEDATGNKLVIDWDAANLLKKKIENGAKFDLAILTGPVIDDLVKENKIVAGSRADIARSGVGIAYRVGAPKPDVSTTEALKSALLAAKSVAYTTQGASGIYFGNLLKRLGIADQVNAKAKLLESGAAAELVARGEAELAVQQISELLPVAGTAVAGPLPPDIQLFTVFSAGLGPDATQRDAAKALVAYLTAPAALPVIAAKGMEKP